MSGTTFPVIIGPTGPVPSTYAALNAELIDAVAAINPGYTANLPGALIEDIASTDTGALVIMDSAMVDTINSVTPYGANEFLLTQLGNVYGVPQGLASNTSVYCVCTGTPGFVVAIGFTFGDGTNTYTVQDGGIVGTAGTNGLGVTLPLFCLAVNSGSFAVPPNTVTQIQTSLPTGVVLTVTNPSTGTPGGAAETKKVTESEF